MTHSPHTSVERRDDAGGRDDAGDRRDHIADERDRRAHDRDDNADQRDVTEQDHTEEIVTRILEVRTEVTTDVGHLEQSESDPDRRAVLTRARTVVNDLLIDVLAEFAHIREQRHAGHRDRGLAADDRHASATDRAASAKDRFDSAGDRDQAAIEREQTDYHGNAQANTPLPASDHMSWVERAIAQSNQRLADGRDLLAQLRRRPRSLTNLPGPDPSNR